MDLRTGIIVLFAIALCYAADEDDQPRPCNIAYRCSMEDQPTWSTDGKKCYVFRNPCHLASANCQRRNRYECVLEVIPKERCQALCDRNCPKTNKPVCGLYNNKKREFGSQCLMEYYICTTGKTYMLYNEGHCDEPFTLKS